MVGSSGSKGDLSLYAVATGIDPHLAPPLQEFSKRDAVLAFSLSRMRVSGDPLGDLRGSHLSFVDFLEALARVAHASSIPTREEIQSTGSSNWFEADRKLRKRGRGE